MQTKNVIVPNISCGHCTARIEKTLNTLKGVASVKAEVPTKAVTVAWDENALSWNEIRAALGKLGSPPED